MKPLTTFLSIALFAMCDSSFAQQKILAPQTPAKPGAMQPAFVPPPAHQRLTKEERVSLRAYRKAAVQQRRNAAQRRAALPSSDESKSKNLNANLPTIPMNIVRRETKSGQTFVQTPVQPQLPLRPLQVYSIPFASSGNVIELSIQNISKVSASTLSVELVNAPEWLTFDKTSISVGSLSSKAEQSAAFQFAVGKSASVNATENLDFVVKTSTGERWTKQIVVSISAPEKFELFQNYPNPFNPTTTICYQLTSDSRVNLKVYNLLGQEVATLVDGERQAGYHQEVLNANRLASGMYIYRIVYINNLGKQSSAQKTMVVVK